MSPQLSFANAAVVTRSETFTGSVTVRAGTIADVQDTATHGPDVIDCEGDLLLPGLIELHTDNVERHLEPRPGVIWPSSMNAMLAHDVQMAGAGITTVFDAISVGDYNEDGKRLELLAKTIDGVRRGKREGVFRCDHFVHLRCEISDARVVAMFEPYATDADVRLMSIMDHTPGQRQWRDLNKMREFHTRKRTYTDDEFREYIETRQAQQQAHSERNRAQILALWQDRDLPIASHDDTTTEHIAEAVDSGITIAEFPTTLEAARAAREHAMVNIMGAPNLVRGGSHSGNVSAGELAENGLLDGLSSDYVPVSLLEGALMLQRHYDYNLNAAVATVTCNIADALALTDRGEIAVGKKADLVRVKRLGDDTAVVRGVWRDGRQVA